ncbi:di-N-acetylchitobiase-like [Leucoraja erinacea]|uniref:di-N-acetylchitobiase-like n=1 Tax=Leucoraja erinaceus TaxID=7782 RepID=UPI0024556922|nr:di-N-acetylchitobiase-like [Leucoraja erinacea]
MFLLIILDTMFLFLCFLPEQIHKNEIVDIRLRSSWINKTLDVIQKNYCDGVHLRFGSVHDTSFIIDLPLLFEEIKTRFTQRIPGSQISFYAPWNCKTGNTICSAIVSASKYADHVHVTSFNVQKHMLLGCFAKANAPYHQTLTGISHYIDKGVNSRKIILTLPWFGYDYTCNRFIEAGGCEISAPCGSINAPRMPYHNIMNLLPKSMSGRIWDDDYKAPFFVYKKDKVFHEVWYDDPESISWKTTFLKKFKLGGIGIWKVDFANYSSDPITAMKTEEMWNALCPP